MDLRLGFFKAKRKPERGNPHDNDLVMAYFGNFQDMVQEPGIHSYDTWNLDETSYRVSVARSDWIVTVDPIHTVYSKSPIGVPKSWIWTQMDADR